MKRRSMTTLVRRTLASAPRLGVVLSQYAQDGRLVFQSDGRKGLGREYVHLAGSLIARRDYAGADAKITYLHTDALESPVASTDASGNVIERTHYEPYGAPIGKVVDGPGYTGHVMDGETGLSYMQQRYYDPEVGAFLSFDPISATEAAFGRCYYANGNPYRFTDPDGRAAEEKVRGARVATVGSAIKGAGVAPGSRMGTLGGGSRNGSAVESPSGAGSTGAPTADGRVPVPSAIGWKTGTYDMAWDPARVDAAGAVISGAGVVGGAAIAADAGIPYLAAASRSIAGGAANTWRNLSFDAPRLAVCMPMDDWREFAGKEGSGGFVLTFIQ
ncbi:RHS repeat-associated core domain-containing protein [Stenotrophomonas forensis]|uniref:Teneurin-like YD-shell domain-containing protein n=1 Tax=Stenotrophomonas forensis TaxID=2871169 RepID=A0ABY7Y4D2_9GAMM|nr:RHS repeat-associated core domain-containing protein [Stenotrophomonas sp. DFS-20110405]WDM64833.1 hypothetical protein K5L94_05965 [Stenotrophomonas sp. DFS-20110405]